MQFDTSRVFREPGLGVRRDQSVVAGEKTKRVCTFRPLLEGDKFAEGALTLGSRDNSVRKFWPFPRATLAEVLKIPYAIKEHNGGNPWEPDEVRKAIGRVRVATRTFI